MYNVGPDFRRSAETRIKCPDCAQIVAPEFCGETGEYRCPACFYDGEEIQPEGE